MSASLTLTTNAIVSVECRPDDDLFIVGVSLCERSAVVAGERSETMQQGNIGSDVGRTQCAVLVVGVGHRLKPCGNTRHAPA